MQVPPRAGVKPFIITCTCRTSQNDIFILCLCMTHQFDLTECLEHGDCAFSCIFACLDAYIAYFSESMDKRRCRWTLSPGHLLTFLRCHLTHLDPPSPFLRIYAVPTLTIGAALFFIFFTCPSHLYIPASSLLSISCCKLVGGWAPLNSLCLSLDSHAMSE